MSHQPVSSSSSGSTSSNNPEHVAESLPPIENEAEDRSLDGDELEVEADTDPATDDLLYRSAAFRGSSSDLESSFFADGFNMGLYDQIHASHNQEERSASSALGEGARFFEQQNRFSNIDQSHNLMDTNAANNITAVASAPAPPPSTRSTRSPRNPRKTASAHSRIGIARIAHHHTTTTAAVAATATTSAGGSSRGTAGAAGIHTSASSTAVTSASRRPQLQKMGDSIMNLLKIGGSGASITSGSSGKARRPSLFETLSRGSIRSSPEDFQEIFLKDESIRGSTKYSHENASNKEGSSLLKLAGYLFLFFKIAIVLVLLVGIILTTEAERGIRISNRIPFRHEMTTSYPTEAPSSSLLQDAIPGIHIDPPPADQIIRIEAFKYRIVQTGLSTSSDLSDIHSIQFYALRWLSDTDLAELDANDHQNTVQLLQRYILAVLFYANHVNIAHFHSNGEYWRYQSQQAPRQEDWESWMTAKEICDWKGISCTTTGTVIGVNLTNSNLDGTIPKELQGLTQLQHLDLSHNQLKGSIPPQLQDLVLLHELFLDHNLLTGSVPSINEFQYLVRLRLNDNVLKGALPNQYDRLSHLRECRLGNNDLVGKIPINMDFATALTNLQLQSNKFTGDLPMFSTLTHLVELNLGRNEFTGTLPVEWADFHSLQKLLVNNNNVKGSIPTDYGSLAKLQYLWINDNELDENIPSELGLCSDLKILNAQGNEFVGDVPPELGQLTAAESLQFHQNYLTGAMPYDICSLHSLAALRFLTADCDTGSIYCDCCEGCH